MQNCVCLTDFSASKNRIQVIYDDAFANLTSLVNLDLTNNQLEQFTSVPRSKSLDSILLAYNRIDTLGNLDRCPNLTVFDIHNNKLVSLPDEVTYLSKLKTLTVSNNDLSDLNPRLALLSNLVRMSIEGNPLKCIKSSMRGAGAEQLKKYLKMRLSENEIAHGEIKENADNNLPNQSLSYDAWDGFLREFVINGQTLDLKNKNLNTIIPKLWLNYPSLISIDLSSNPLLGSIPEEIGNLVNLKQLRLSGCSLKSLPVSFLLLE